MFKVKEGINLNGALITNPSGVLTAGNMHLIQSGGAASLDIQASFDTQVLKFTYGTSDYHTITTSFNGGAAAANYISFNVEYATSDIRRALIIRGDGSVSVTGALDSASATVGKITNSSYYGSLAYSLAGGTSFNIINSASPTGATSEIRLYPRSDTAASLTTTSAGVTIPGVLEIGNGTTNFALQVNKGDTNANGIGINTDTTVATQGANITIRPSSSNIGQTAIIIQGYDKTGRWCMNGQDAPSNYDLTFYSGPSWTPQVIMYAGGGMKVNGHLYVTGNVYTEYSDINLKTQLGKIENAVDKICAIDTFYYEPNALALSLGALPGRRVGVSAQSVQQIAEEVVGPSALGKDYLTVQYERLVPYLIEAVKEQQETIKKQQEQINALLAKLGV